MNVNVNEIKLPIKSKRLTGFLFFKLHYMGYLFEIFLQYTDSEKWKIQTWENMCKECEQTKKRKHKQIKILLSDKVEFKAKSAKWKILWP